MQSAITQGKKLSYSGPTYCSVVYMHMPFRLSQFPVVPGATHHKACVYMFEQYKLEILWRPREGWREEGGGLFSGCQERIVGSLAVQVLYWRAGGDYMYVYVYLLLLQSN